MIIVVRQKGEPMTNADKFKQIFGLYATELWSKTEVEFLAWLNSDFSQSDVPDMNVGDMISRQDAIDAVSRGCQEFRGIFARCEKNLNELPSAKPEPCEDAVSRAEAQTALQFVARRYTVAHEAHGEGHVCRTVRKFRTTGYHAVNGCQKKQENTYVLALMQEDCWSH